VSGQPGETGPLPIGIGVHTGAAYVGVLGLRATFSTSLRSATRSTLRSA
jgi:class 3 adenylate cyclase